MGLDSKRIANWKKNNATADDIGYSSDISERGLEIIKNAEGGRTKDTNLYGITQAGLDGLETLTNRYGIKVPDWAIGADVMKLSENQCREVAGYIAALNTRLVDTFSKTNNFSTLPLETKTGFLTYLHNESPYRLRKSFAKGMPGSFLKAVQTGNPYEMGVALMSNSDGSPLENDGFARRKMIALMAIGNKNYTFDAGQERDLDIRRKQPRFYEETQKRVRRLANDWYVPRQEIQERYQNPMQWLKSTKTPDELKSESQMTEENNSKTGFFANLTNNIKNLFTNSEENTNVAQGNQDINLQQSPSIARGGTNQLSGRPDDQSSQSV